MKTLIAFLALTASLAFSQTASNTCPDGHASDYAFVICDTQKVNQQVVRYFFPDDFFKSTGNVQVNASDVSVIKDPNGEYTLLWGRDFKVYENQTIDIQLTFAVTGANTVNAWTHQCNVTGTGKMTFEQAILGANGQPSMSALAVCPSGWGKHDAQKGASFGSNGKPVWTKVTIHLEGGPNGTAFAHSGGTHYNP